MESRDRALVKISNSEYYWELYNKHRPIAYEPEVSQNISINHQAFFLSHHAPVSSDSKMIAA